MDNLSLDRFHLANTIEDCGQVYYLADGKYYPIVDGSIDITLTTIARFQKAGIKFTPVVKINSENTAEFRDSELLSLRDKLGCRLNNDEETDCVCLIDHNFLTAARKNGITVDIGDAIPAPDIGTTAKTALAFRRAAFVVTAVVMTGAIAGMLLNDDHLKPILTHVLFNVSTTTFRAAAKITGVLGVAALLCSDHIAITYGRPVVDRALPTRRPVNMINEKIRQAVQATAG